MVIIQENDFYEDHVFSATSKFYQEFIKNFDSVRNLYNRIVDSHIDFIVNTGCYFEDMSANNIMIDSDYNEFKIIDVFSIRRVGSYTGWGGDKKYQQVDFIPLSMMVCKKLETGGLLYSEDKTLNKFLDGINRIDIKKNILNKIPVRSIRPE